jgi:hypothetical protein
MCVYQIQTLRTAFRHDVTSSRGCQGTSRPMTCVLIGRMIHSLINITLTFGVVFLYNKEIIHYRDIDKHILYVMFWPVEVNWCDTLELPGIYHSLGIDRVLCSPACWLSSTHFVLHVCYTFQLILLAYFLWFLFLFLIPHILYWVIVRWIPRLI